MDCHLMSSLTGYEMVCDLSKHIGISTQSLAKGATVTSIFATIPPGSMSRYISFVSYWLILLRMYKAGDTSQQNCTQ